jgi:hypothetical protein
MSDNNNVLVYSTTKGSADEAEDTKQKTVMRKKSMSMENTEIRNKIMIRLSRKTNSCNFARKDFFGNIISKDFKEQKVSFRDLISLKPLTEVVPVQRIRYSDNRIDNTVGRVEMAKCECKCLIF